jgi:hypothetical protein
MNVPTSRFIFRKSEKASSKIEEAKITDNRRSSYLPEEFLLQELAPCLVQAKKIMAYKAGCRVSLG